MNWIFSIALILFLIVFLQDVRWRSIWWFLPVAIFLAGIAYRYADWSYQSVFWNLCFVGGMMGFLWLYIRLRFSEKPEFFAYFGLGDVLFLFAICPFFPFPTFMYVFTFGTCFSLLIHGLLSAFKKQKTIPYAGYLALFSGGLLLLEKLEWLHLNPRL